ncbi:Toll-Interleukin receptor domain-containing protein [Heterostelium album PN500]|uniref:Toll-Interleukin receptor domain-containing protein n=1 Tax=Heterostelium pallidum (strain ATCC 26659 / Pp 5 / PN500) TaxID=670386 RepID=D3B3K4_HETP5|nr:Toll-Interleukin receptor domain-containing protein [Heterostelium album PN500]EFA83902.1 Toll-Interleukin receptor domain-containing protein [Heterostelium album PN500]|eukprot:XP_020436019.1 Toll-Interleukin receptor domain-containing protein [Heterostelium album PN500]
MPISSSNNSGGGNTTTSSSVSKKLVFKNKKIFLIPKTSSVSWSHKAHAKKTLEIYGATVSFAIVPKETDYIVVLEGHDRSRTSLHPNLMSAYQKSIKFNIPMFIEDFIYSSISSAKLKDLPSFRFNMELPKNSINGNSKYFDLGYDDDDTNSESSSKDVYGLFDDFETTNNTQTAETLDSDDDDESIYSEADMFGLFDDYIAPKTSKQQQPNQQQQQQIAYFDDEEENDFFAMFGDSPIISQQPQLTFEDEEEEESIQVTIPKNKIQPQLQPQLQPQPQIQSKTQLIFNEENEIKDMFGMDTPYFNTKNSNVGYSFYVVGDKLKLIELPLKLKQIDVSQSGFISFIDCTDKLYSWGKLSNSVKFPQVKKLTAPQNVTKFLDVICTKNNIISLDTEGQCWEIEEKKQQQPQQQEQNQKQQRQKLSRGVGVAVQDNPVDFSLKHLKLPFLVKTISSGNQFVVALTESGRLVSWGTTNNLRGQLGRELKNPKDSNIPQFIPDVQRATFVSCGFEHSMAIVIQNGVESVFGWGDSAKQQLGYISEKAQNTATPMLIHTKQTHINVICNENYSVIIDEDIKFSGLSFPMEFHTINLVIHPLRTIPNTFKLFKYKHSVGVTLFDTYSTAYCFIQVDRLDLLKSLLSGKLDFSQTKMISLIMYSIELNNLEIFKYLYHRFENVSLEVRTGNADLSYLHYAVENICLPIMKYILKNKLLKVDITNSVGDTPLHTSSNESLLMLCEYGCDRNLKNAKGYTALHLATQDNKLAISMLLLKNGAQAITDRAMKTPLQYVNGKEKTLLQNIMFTNEVFLSYAHKDIGFVRELRIAMEQYSIRCWLDEYRLQAGCDWRAEITKGVANAQVIIYTISETSSISLWCRKELKMARRLGKTIIALYYHNVEIDPILRGLFDYEFKTAAPLDPNEDIFITEMEKLAKITKNIIHGHKLAKIYPTQKDLIEHFGNRSIYISFCDREYKLFNFIRELLLIRGVPIFDRDFLLGNTNKNVAKVVNTAVEAKEEKEQTIRLTKRERRLHSVFGFSQDLFDSPQQEVPILNDYTMTLAHQSEHPDDQADQKSPVEKINKSSDEYLEKFKDIQDLHPHISKSILHLVINPSVDSEFSQIQKEIEFSTGDEKSIFVITTNYKEKSKCNNMLKNCTWFELNYQKEDEFIDKILFNYEVIDKTHLTINRIMHELSK